MNNNIIMKQNVYNYYKNITDNSNFNIMALLVNAKNDNNFNKMLKLCIKYDIQIVSNINNVWNIRTNEEIINDINETIKKIILNYTYLLLNDNNLIELIDKHTIEFKKKIKDIDFLKQLFLNKYNDIELYNICNLVSPKNDIKKKKQKITKYIAEYSN